MTSTVYTDLVGPPVNAAWLNDVNNNVYNAVGATPGTVARTVQSKLQESVSVLDFGASTSATAAVNAAAFATAWATSAPQAVLVPAGTYLFTGTVVGKFYSFGVVTISGGTVTTINNLVP